MNFEQFWAELQKGGCTQKGNAYSVIEGDRLHILSPGNSNLENHIRKAKVKEYFQILETGAMTPGVFQVRRAAYFYDVYTHIV